MNNRFLRMLHCRLGDFWKNISASSGDTFAAHGNPGESRHSGDADPRKTETTELGCGFSAHVAARRTAEW
jgi:hypothetical protein